MSDADEAINEVREAEKLLLSLNLIQEYIAAIMEQLAEVIPDYHSLNQYEQIVYLMNSSTAIRQRAIISVLEPKDPASTKM